MTIHTLQSATLEVAKIITSVQGPEVATGGSATTIINTGSYNPYADDYWNNGTIWVMSGNNAGKSAIITDWVQSTETWTFPTMTLLCAAADVYYVANKDYPQQILRQGVNVALQSISGLDYEDATLTTVADQMDYALPSGVYNVKRVEVAANTSAPYDYDVVDGAYWRTVGTNISLAEGHQFTSTGYYIRLTYNIPSTAITTDAGTIPDAVAIDWLKWAAAVHCLRWRMGRTKEDEPSVKEALALAMAEEAKAASIHQVRKGNIMRTPQYGPFAGDDEADYTFVPGTVRI